MKKTVLIILLLTSLVYSQKYYNWETKEVPAEIKSAVSISSDSILIYTENFTFYSTTDGGDNWSEIQLTLPGVVEIALNKINSSIFITSSNELSEGKLFVTDDLGESIEEVTTPSNNIFLKIFSYSDNLLAVDYTNQELHLSSDGGYSWQFYTNLPVQTGLDLQVSSPGDIYCHNGDSILKYDTQIEEWVSFDVPGFITGFTVSDSFLMASGDQHYISSDGGENWVESEYFFKTVQYLCDDNYNPYIRLTAGYNFPPYHGIFNIQFSPLQLEQICSVPQEVKKIIFNNEGMIYFSESIMYIQKEEIFPEFKSTFFPLNLGNEWLYTEAAGDFSVPSSSYTINHYVTNMDTTIDGKKFFNGPSGLSRNYFHFDLTENRIFSYHPSTGVQEGISFNYQNYYYQPIAGEGTDKQHLFPMYEETCLLNGEELTIKNINEEFLLWEAQYSVGFLENFGLYSEDWHGVFGDYGSSNLRQAKIYSTPDDFITFDIVEDPEIVVSTPEQHEKGILNFNVKVEHDLSNKGINGSVNFIKNLEFVYFYDDAGVTSNVDTIVIPADSLGNKCTFYTFDFALDTNKVGGHGRFFKYRFIAETKGIFPHFGVSPAEGWHELEYIPTSVDNDDVIYDYFLSANYPNPFNPSTRMEFTLPKESDVEISVFNVTGQMLFTAAEGNYRAGRHELNINMRDYTSGVYFVRMITGHNVLINKIMLLK